MVLHTSCQSPATWWHITWNPTASYSMKPFGQMLRKGFWAVWPCIPEQYFQLSSVNTTYNWELFTWYWGELLPGSLTYPQDYI